jgi:hypothetical protein
MFTPHLDTLFVDYGTVNTMPALALTSNFCARAWQGPMKQRAAATSSTREDPQQELARRPALTALLRSIICVQFNAAEQ